MKDCTHITRLLPEYLDGSLPPEMREAAEAHFRTCETCRAEKEALEAVAATVAALPPALEPPRDLWPDIAARLSAPLRENALSEAERRRNGVADRPPVPGPARHTGRRRLPAWTRRAAALAVLLVAALGAFLLVPILFEPAWSVTRVDGAPRIGKSTLIDRGHLRRGQWLETDGRSRAALDVGVIGNVEVEPNTRLRLVAARSGEHRMALEEGTIHARIWAPPRLFFVETPSALAIDLGCAYTLTVDSTGGSLLHVTSGYVALEHGDRTAVVPAGSMCLTRTGRGPGTPFRARASDAFRRALVLLDFEEGGSDALTILLREAQQEDAATLWELLYRLDLPDRGRLYDRLVALVPPPEGVTREGVLNADPGMIEAWHIHLGLDLDSGWLFRKKPPRLQP